MLTLQSHASSRSAAAEEQLATLQSDLEELSKAQVAAVARAESAEQRLALLDACQKNIPTAGSSRRKAATGGDKKGDGIEAGSGESGESEAQQQLLQHLQDELMVKNAQLLRSAAELEKLRLVMLPEDKRKISCCRKNMPSAPTLPRVTMPRAVPPMARQVTVGRSTTLHFGELSRTRPPKLTILNLAWRPQEAVLGWPGGY